MGCDIRFGVVLPEDLSDRNFVMLTYAADNEKADASKKQLIGPKPTKRPFLEFEGVKIFEGAQK